MRLLTGNSGAGQKHGATDRAIFRQSGDIIGWNQYGIRNIGRIKVCQKLKVFTT